MSFGGEDLDLLVQRVNHILADLAFCRANQARVRGGEGRNWMRIGPSVTEEPDLVRTDRDVNRRVKQEPKT